MNDLKGHPSQHQGNHHHHSSQISQHPQAIQAANQIPQHHVSSSQSGNNANNNNNIVIVPQLQQPMVAAPYAGPQAPPQITAINIGAVGGLPGPTRYRREANHLVHFLLSLIFPPWMFVWCIICCCFGCPNICCCCGDGDVCDNCCPKYEDAPPTARATTWI